MSSDDQDNQNLRPTNSSTPADQRAGNKQRAPPPIPPLALHPNIYEESYDDEEEEEEEEEESLLEILIQSLTGTTFQVRVSPWETGGGLKNLLHKSQGIPAIHQHLLLGDRELLDDESLIDQGIQDGATLKLILSLKGGPVNSRRIPPHDDSVWREFTDYFEMNREELWDESPARQVTVLVLHEGDAVNLYRVVENDDGSFSPLDESWSSETSGGTKEDLIEAKVDENTKAQSRINELRQQMEALKLNKKARRQKNKKPVSPALSVSRGSRKLSRKSISPRTIKPTKEYHASNANHIGATSSRKSSIDGLPSSNPSRSVIVRGGSRPVSQSNLRDANRLSISRGSTVLDELPGSLPPKHVDFSRHARLESIRPLRERNSLGPLKENTAASPLPERGKKYEAYRQALVRHGKLHNLPNEVNAEERPSLSGREGPLPMYMNQPKPKKRKNIARLNKTHNEPSLKILHEFDDRPKTSPEVFERPDSASTSTTISDIIQLKGADDKLKEIIGILNSSRANTPSTHRSSDSYASHWLPQGQKTLMNSRNARGSLSLSMASLRALSPTSICSTPPLLMRSNPKNKRKTYSEVYRSTNGQFRSSGRPSTPESLRRTKRNAKAVGKVTTTNGLPVVKNKKRSQPRCTECRKKLIVGLTFTCRCGLTFCSQHRYAETHSCSYDYKAQGKKLIELANPLVEPSKLPKI